MKRGLLASVAAICAAVVTVYAADGNVGRDDRGICLDIARRQVELFDAKVRNDWRAIYGMLPPRLKNAGGLDDFIRGYQTFGAPEEARISGAVTGPATGIPQDADTELLLKMPLIPRHLGYRMVEFHLSADRNSARVSSRITLPAPAMVGPTVMQVMNEEFWQKVDGVWHVAWDLKPIFHMSGASTAKGVLPKFDTHIKAVDIAFSLLEEAAGQPEGDERLHLMDEALLVDPFYSIEVIAHEGMDAGDLPAKRLKRQLAAHLSDTGVFFPMMMEKGYWFGLIGDYASSYDGYYKATLMDPFDPAARASAASTALAKGEAETAVGHYRRLLELVSVRMAKQPETLERHITGLRCRLCPHLTGKSVRELALSLVEAAKWKEALSVYTWLLKERKEWSGILYRLKKGESVRLRDLLGPELYDDSKSLTWHDVSMLLKAAGISLHHPADLPFAGASGKGAGLRLESVPMAPFTDYFPNYATTIIRGEAGVYRDGEALTKSGGEGGYAAVFLDGNGKEEARFFRDDNPTVAGSSELEEAMAGMKDGEHVCIARAAARPVHLEGNLLDALSSLGVDVSRLGGSQFAHVICGAKGDGGESAKTWAGKYRIRKVFSPSNMESGEKGRSGSVVISGHGSGAEVRFIPAGGKRQEK